MSFEFASDFFAIIWLDIVLSGDNALIIGLAAAGLSPELRRKAILFGMIMAAVLRIIFAAGATYLLQIPGLTFAGALLLLWVAWRLWQEIRAQIPQKADEVVEDVGHIREGEGYTGVPTKTLGSALLSITVADLSMSIDNVLAVAAIADENVELLVFGLVLSIALMGLAATMIVKILVRYPWVSYLGVAMLIYVAGDMMYHGWPEVIGLMGMEPAVHG